MQSSGAKKKSKTNYGWFTISYTKIVQKVRDKIVYSNAPEATQHFYYNLNSLEFDDNNC